MSKIDDVLVGVTALGFDTAPLIYFVERHPTYVDIVREFVQRVDTGAVLGYSSMVTLTEVLTQPKQKGNTTVEQEYRDLLLQSRNFKLLPIDSTIAERAADLRARYRFRTPDALQIAAALASGCQAFLTNDPPLKRAVELRVIVLDDLKDR
ncbi:MAG: PIN domain-containing protein [Deltaproteobacteria bacterium]|nr:PIN domain-containing protein [Deltaproteobacteria bacterium]